jgi:hypothetical protein
MQFLQVKNKVKYFLGNKKFNILCVIDNILNGSLNQISEADLRVRRINGLKSDSKILYIGADFNQDKSTILIGLNLVFKNIVLFTNKDGEYSFSRKIEKNLKNKNGDRLLELIKIHDIDFVIGQLWGSFFRERELSIAKTKCKMIGISWDDALPELWLQKRKKSFYSIAANFDQILLSNMKYKTRYESIVSKVGYLPMGYASGIHDKITNSSINESNYDVVFIANNYGYRKSIVKALKQVPNLKLGLFGRDMPDGYIDSWDIPKVVSQSKIVIGCGLVGNSSSRTTMKLRDIECMVSNSCYITFPSQELSIIGGDAIVDYANVEELIKKITLFLNNNNDRLEIIKKQKETFSDYKWEEIIKSLVDE